MSNVTTGSKRVHRSGAKNSADQTTALCGKVMAHRLFRTEAPANCKACDDAVIAEQNAPSAERIAELHPAATETPVPLDTPAAVREYIEAEWRGAALVMSAKRGEVIAALLAADPELSNTAASFRFHNLVAEMRDNDSIEPQPRLSNDAVIRAAVRAERERKANERMAAKIAANDSLPLNVMPPAQGLALLQSLDASIAAADAELARRDALLATGPDTSGYGEGFCRCGRVFMWGECAAGHKNVAPGNWEPIAYSTGLHEFSPTAGGTVCVTPCLRPDGTVQPCGDPVKGAIHDPQAYAEYATELTEALKSWAAKPAAVALANVDAAAKKSASFISCPRGCGVDVRNHHSSDSVNGGCDTGPMPVADMRDWFAARGVGQLGYSMADAVAEHYGKTEDELNEVYDAMHGPIA